MSSKVTQAEFARMRGWSRSHVTGLKHAGRLVVEKNGKRDLVLVEESLAKIDATKDPNRDDVAKRHAANREGEQPASAPAAPTDDRVSATYQQSRAVKERYVALQAKTEYEERIGKMAAVDDVNRAFAAQWNQLRISMDHLRDQISAELAGESDPDVVHAMLGEHFELLQGELCRKMEETIGVKS